METKASDSKKLFKVFDASKRRRTRKKNGIDDTNSLGTDNSGSVCQDNNVRRLSSSAKPSFHAVPTTQTIEVSKESRLAKRDRDSSPSVCYSQCNGRRKPRSPEDQRCSRSPRHHRRPVRDGKSLALKAGLVSTPRSISPHQDGEGGIESITQDQDSFIYTFLEDAIKRDKKKQRHSRRQHEEYHTYHEREPSVPRRHRHHHRRRCEELPSRDRERESSKKESVPVTIDQMALLETFAKMCAQLHERTIPCNTPQVPRTQSHKSLQCEGVSRCGSYTIEKNPIKLESPNHSTENISRTSQENIPDRVHSSDKLPINSKRNLIMKQNKCECCSPYEKNLDYMNKLDLNSSRINHLEEDGYREYHSNTVPARRYINHCRSPAHHRDHDRDGIRHYDDKRRYFEQKTSRSFDVHREPYMDDDKYCRRTARSEANKEKLYEDYRNKRYEHDKYYDKRHLDRESFNVPRRDKRSKRNMERLERNSVGSREYDYRHRDRNSDKERDTELSVADGDTSTVSGRSNYLRAFKQEISEQREAMDKMMKLWKELMRCLKGISVQAQGQDKIAQDSAANVRESAAAQLRLWRECMQRYETVARDVGDTDARLMEEINKQRSEMAEMATMWQECLQRYREMSTDFNSLKQKLVTPESPTRLSAPPQVCGEGEGIVPGPYRLPPSYAPMGPMAAGYCGGSPLRTRASAPPAWWWPGEGPRSPRRRSSQDSRCSRDREHRHRHKDGERENSRSKEKSSKPGAARSEHRHRKR